MFATQQYAPQQYGVSPQQLTVAPAQTTFDISSLLNLIIPIMGLALVMGMMMPMMKGMTEGFGGGR